MSEDYKVKFSGKKEEFQSGATRDSRKNRGRFDFIPPEPLRQLAVLYEQGAENHGSRNWEKGFSFSRAIDSALRHINQYREGYRDENHLINAVWNLFAIVQFRVMIERGLLPKDLDDLPNYLKSNKSESKEKIECDLCERSPLINEEEDEFECCTKLINDIQVEGYRLHKKDNPNCKCKK